MTPRLRSGQWAGCRRGARSGRPGPWDPPYAPHALSSGSAGGCWAPGRPRRPELKTRSHRVEEASSRAAWHSEPPLGPAKGARNRCMLVSHCIEPWGVAGLSQDWCAFVSSHGTPQTTHYPTPQTKNRERSSHASRVRHSRAPRPACPTAPDSHRAGPSRPLRGDASALPTTNRWQQWLPGDCGFKSANKWI